MRAGLGLPLELRRKSAISTFVSETFSNQFVKDDTPFLYPASYKHPYQ